MQTPVSSGFLTDARGCPAPATATCPGKHLRQTQQSTCRLLQPCLESQEISRKGATCCLLACCLDSSSCGNTQGQESKHIIRHTSHTGTRTLQPIRCWHLTISECFQETPVCCGVSPLSHLLGLRDDVGPCGLCAHPGPLPCFPSVCISWALTARCWGA